MKSHSNSTSFYILLIIGCLFSSPVHGQLKHFSTQDGLSSDENRVVYQDHLSNIWVGGLKGADRWNGSEWKRFYPNEFVEAITEDRDGNLWLAVSGQGLFRRGGGKEKQFTNQDGLSGAGEIIELLGDSKGRVWASSWNAGIDVFQDDEWTHFNSSNSDLGGNIVDV
ncbi:MAG: hypothetical protein JJ975_13530, partial [Bacteroidia bacterium]|nr:hypothetical protein [Bacteroidia bacterium]